MKQALENDVQYLRIGLGWDCGDNGGHDLDLAAFLLDGEEKITGDDGVIFYNQAVYGDNALVFAGDNTTGEGDGMDESIFVDLAKIPANVQSLVFGVTFSHSQGQCQFGEVLNAEFAAARVTDQYDKGSDVFSLVNLSEDYPARSGMAVAKLSRTDGGWEYEEICETADGGLEEFCQRFGVNVE